MKLSKILILIGILSGCAAIGTNQLNKLYGQAEPRQRLVSSTSAEGMYFHKHIKPILDGRCVVCHACYDAPCQIKLTSPTGIDRGASKTKVYDGTRLLAAKPTRLFIDAQTTEQWRKHHFFPVLNERDQTPEANLAGSLIYQSLLLKKRQADNQNALLPAVYDLSLNRKNECPTIEEYPHFAQQNPSTGMPYALPALSKQEHHHLTEWIRTGAKMSPLPPLNSFQTRSVNEWEHFLNQNSLKAQLISRYIYEHWFLASLYFDEENAPSQYFRLVRSYTPPGQTVDVVPTRQPYGDPKVERIYYRFQPISASIVTKTHMPYALNIQRKNWINALFFEPNYTVNTLPGYVEKVAANPFVTFRDLPARSRYRFILEESENLIMGFMKGPVCRGQVAVDVINDHFWVVFVEPDGKAIPMLDDFLESQSESLVLPGQDGSNAGLLAHWTKYADANKNYLLAKRKAMNALFKEGHALDMNIIWRGDGDNPNAALTIFRHFDSASVVKGLVGNNPKTAWVVDYPLLERIHYLLTAEFDVYGNIGHQLNTRLYMDFLRFEGEFNFLTLLPPSSRLKLRDHWYRNANDNVKDHLYSCESYIEQTPMINYSSANPKNELYTKLKEYLATVLNHSYDINQAPLQYKEPLQSIANLRGMAASLLPESTVLLIEDKKRGDHLLTLLGNRAHSNISSLFKERQNRLPEEDTVTLVYGVIGDYPNAFWKVSAQDLPQLARQVSQLKTENDYHALMEQFGIRRTHPNFWQHSDRVHAIYQSQQPAVAGIMDYNRLENR